MDLTYFPLAAGGFALMTLSIRILALSRSLSAPKETLPMGAWMIAGLVDPVLHLAGLDLPDRLGHVEGDRARLGVGHEAARAPAPCPSLPTDRIMSGVATTASKSSQFSVWIFVTMSSPPTKSAPASWASLSFSPDGDDQHLLGLAAEPVGQDDRAPHHLIGVLGIDPEAHRHFDGLVELGERGLRHRGHGLGQRVLRLRRRPLSRPP